MPSAAFDTIHQAIQQKCSVSTLYQGHPREMSPHVLGYKNGSEHALLYQYGGSSKSGLGVVGSGQNWRCVFIDQLSDVTLIPGVFQTAPLALVERAVENSSRVGDVVADFFLGSGSTLIAAERTGRVCYGMEIDPHYASVILARWEAFSGGTARKLE